MAIRTLRQRSFLLGRPAGPGPQQAIEPDGRRLVFAPAEQMVGMAGLTVAVVRELLGQLLAEPLHVSRSLHPVQAVDAALRQVFIPCSSAGTAS